MKSSLRTDAERIHPSESRSENILASAYQIRQELDALIHIIQNEFPPANEKRAGHVDTQIRANLLGLSMRVHVLLESNNYNTEYTHGPTTKLDINHNLRQINIDIDLARSDHVS